MGSLAAVVLAQAASVAGTRHPIVAQPAADPLAAPLGSSRSWEMREKKCGCGCGCVIMDYCMRGAATTMRECARALPVMRTLISALTRP